VTRTGNHGRMRETRPALPSRYTTPELIAYGGMGEVYRATDESLGRTVAVKLLSERYARNEEFHARFVREARTAASLSGEPNVIVIHDVGETVDDLPFIVMEYVPGGTVADRLRAGRVAPDQSLSWLGQTAAALDRAHARGIVHRDVKPANLLVAEDGAIRVSDFGIARAAGDDTLTAAGSVPTPASDRYALACVAFELLTGRRPFERDNPTVEAAAHATEPPPTPRAVDPSLPAALGAVFARGLAKRPDERYASCAALVDDLRDALARRSATTATVVAAPATPSSPSVTRHRSRPRGAVVLLGVLGLLGAGAALAWVLTGVGEGSSGSTVVLTQTVQGEESTVVVTETVEGETVERTVTADEEGEAEPPPPPSGQDGVALNDQGFELLQAGNAEAALPVLESAVAALRGSSSITEAYASYNLATARFALGRCDGVAELLDRSEQVQGERREIDRLRKQVEKRCEGD
jgi:tRNA A-37 threonylcarbamoyl transferase component Bud32